MPPIYGKSRALNSGDKSGARLLVEKMTCTSRKAKLCGMFFRPSGAGWRRVEFPTAYAVGYGLTPCGLRTRLQGSQVNEWAAKPVILISICINSRDPPSWVDHTQTALLFGSGFAGLESGLR